MNNLENPREEGRQAVRATVAPDVWESNLNFTNKVEAMIAKHPISTHPLKEFFENETISEEKSLVLHLEFGVAFAQIFTDAVLMAMSQSKQMEQRLGPTAKVTARFLWCINLMDELGYVPGNNGEHYRGNPFDAHYFLYVDMFKDMGGDIKDIVAHQATAESLAARATFTDHYDDYTYLTCVLALSESIFDGFAGSWAKNVERSTGVDTSKGYHTIHVEDDEGESIDDDHSEDGWTLARQAIEPAQHIAIEEKVNEWLDTWYKFADKMMELAMA